jgi:hypothetical protein
MTVYGQTTTVDGACGVGLVYDFGHSTYYARYDPTTKNQGGAGWMCAGFIENDSLSDEMFKQLSDKYNLVYRTPTRINVNSGNPFYFAVFDTQGSGVPTGFDECDEEN